MSVLAHTVAVQSTETRLKKWQPCLRIFSSLRTNSRASSLTLFSHLTMERISALSRSPICKSSRRSLTLPSCAIPYTNDRKSSARKCYTSQIPISNFEQNRCMTDETRLEMCSQHRRPQERFTSNAIELCYRVFNMKDCIEIVVTLFCISCN
jgi:hypothetical protein